MEQQYGVSLLVGEFTWKTKLLPCFLSPQLQQFYPISNTIIISFFHNTHISINTSDSNTLRININSKTLISTNHITSYLQKSSIFEELISIQTYIINITFFFITSIHAIINPTPFNSLKRSRLNFPQTPTRKIEVDSPSAKKA